MILSEQIIGEYLKAQTQVINKVLMQVIGREPTAQDYIKCEKVYFSGHPSKWYLIYDGINLGWIETRTSWPKDNNKGMGLGISKKDKVMYMVTFTPDSNSPAAKV